MTFFYFLSLTLFLLLCAVLCFVVLIQESKSTGLGASFGGESGDSLFGTSTADVLKKFTMTLGGIFLASCVFLSMWTEALSHNQGRTPAEAVIEQSEGQ
ncbi:MAG: preprotein translocase subunit SecG [Parachlamydiaceae bacterium]|nr:preprotein translocase subunit SecG [Parachlamydiaceae bacterium]